MWLWCLTFLWVPSVGWRRWVGRQAEERTLMAWISPARCVCVCACMSVYIQCYPPTHCVYPWTLRNVLNAFLSSIKHFKRWFLTRQVVSSKGGLYKGWSEELIRWCKTRETIVLHAARMASLVWQFYQVSEKDNKFSICKLCSKEIPVEECN